jgi:metallophosphoesterase (TIGR03767 family)
VNEQTFTTVDRTIARDSASQLGWRELHEAEGEALRESALGGQTIACIWHLSDLHICDAESPARLEYLDRFSDPDSEYREALGDIGTYRPQEILTVQVATAMVETVNSIDTAPVSGSPIDVVLITGDVTDNAQVNELGWYQGVLEGGTISPRSGNEQRSSWVGVSDAATWDERYWHPDGPPSGMEPDRPMRIYGFPRVPGLIEAARRDVVSPGLTLPWISVYGNHDGLLQGTVAPTPELNDLATGSQRITGLPEGRTPRDYDLSTSIAMNGPADYPHDDTSPRQRIEPDARRAFVGPDEFARVTDADASDRPNARNYFAREVGDLVLLSLDTVNPHGGWQGSIDSDQCAWLVRKLKEYSHRYVVIASHHPSPCLTNGFAPKGALSRVLGRELVEILLSHPNVIAWIAGHVHHHAALWHHDGYHGFWEITTSSLIDWPQQGRILEFIRVNERGLSEIAIISTVVDHAGPVRADYRALNSPSDLASISRTLAANDYRLRDSSLRGLTLDSSPEVRNCIWRLQDPLA